MQKAADAALAQEIEVEVALSRIDAAATERPISVKKWKSTTAILFGSERKGGAL